MHSVSRNAALLLVTAAVALSSCHPRVAPKPASETTTAADPTTKIRSATSAVDDARLRAAGQNPANWLTHGGSYAELRYSPLDQITAENVGQLSLAWYYDTNTNRGLEATPLVVDGIMYTTGSWSVVFALDAATGKEIWKYDPQVPRETGPKACCDVVNRGVALYKGKVFVGTLDGRLVALDASTGQAVWSVVTVDQSRPYTITGAPRVVDGKVIIGNGGAELGVRGYVSAYDTDSGKLVWRFFTVPGDPSQPFESEALRQAAPTWTGGEWWKVGGGGTCWDSMAYDPELNLLYVGTGNGSPWSRYVRSPGGGDNLYLSSIIALRPQNGELAWYYQETPGDTWDYTATQHIILADLPIDGQTRKVLLHAPKNGFFYVIDRENGKLISAEKYVEANWAKRIDLKTGRPVEDKAVHYKSKTTIVKPSQLGAHNWHPMSFNPKTGLVYIPAQDSPAIFALDKGWKYRPGAWNTGTDFTLIKGFPSAAASGTLLAWDPIRQKAAWRVPHKSLWNGGTLTTAGNLVFQGTADGRFVAYRADNGTKVWETAAQTGVVAAPITYSVDGQQYVSVMAGWGGVFALYGGAAAAANHVRNLGRVLTFKLGGTAALPALPPEVKPLVSFRKERPKKALVDKGEGLYSRYCQTCHGAGVIGGGVLPDLRFISPEVQAGFSTIVIAGALKTRGMPSFGEWLNDDDAHAILAYIQKRSLEDAAAPESR